MNNGRTLKTIDISVSGISVFRAVQIANHLLKDGGANGLTRYLAALFITIMLAIFWSIYTIIRIRPRYDIILSHCIGMIVLVITLEGVYEKSIEGVTSDDT